ncbi:Neurotransmitter-gated ion-channel ligand binding domain protein [Ancylostoma ceylanicum]|uniref:Neurotransmitter-gated ion-channel ligand binding domain protein n=1 Tax=Ancylostoma ceylanicum TaxID=53326 RepID=A0A0D6LHE9_9BILA|nr:Neurotransmitter-gated ion-channel ligand binding domain protein [Ancylostoma ceylanicum]
MKELVVLEKETEDVIIRSLDHFFRKGVANNVTTLLNQILEGYDRHLRPGFNMRRTTVFIDIFVRTMGPIADLTDTYSFNCYFRQMWTDSRLKFNGTHNKQLSLSMAMLDKIWKPDTYFWNGARSYTHTMTTSNRLVRLYPDGTVLYSSRLTIKGKCAMSMRRYPLDRQACRLVIGSYAFGADELLYDWRVMGADRGVQLRAGISGNYSALETRSDGGRHSMYHRVRNFSVKKKLLTPQFSVSSNDGQLQNIQEFQQDSVGWRLYYWMMNNGRPTDPFGLAQNSISAVDRFSRIALPIYFVAVVVVYYNFYVNTPYDFTFDDDYIKNPL